MQAATAGLDPLTGATTGVELQKVASIAPGEIEAGATGFYQAAGALTYDATDDSVIFQVTLSDGGVAGAVAAVQNIPNPVQLARLVMSESEHVLLIAEGAMRFADHCGVARAPDSYFTTADRVAQLERARFLLRGDVTDTAQIFNPLPIPQPFGQGRVHEVARAMEHGQCGHQPDA